METVSTPLTGPFLTIDFMVFPPTVLHLKGNIRRAQKPMNFWERRMLKKRFLWGGRLSGPTLLFLLRARIRFAYANLPSLSRLFRRRGPDSPIGDRHRGPSLGNPLLFYGPTRIFFEEGNRFHLTN